MSESNLKGKKVRNILNTASNIGFKVLVEVFQNMRVDYFNKISEKYNMVVKNIIKDFLNYIIINKKEYVSKQLLDFTEFILHIPNAPNEYIINYFSISLHEILNDSLNNYFNAQ